LVIIDDVDFGLECYNILRLGAFLALDDSKLNTLTFIEVSVTIANNSIVMDKNISASITLDKAIALRAIEPLYSTLFFSHDLELLS